MEFKLTKFAPLAAVPILFLVGCFGNEDEEIALLEAEYEELDDKLDEKKSIQSKLTKEKGELSKSIRDFQYNQKKEAKMLLELQPIVDYIGKLEQSEKYLESELSLWRPGTRKSFEGVKLGNLEVGGKNYPDAVISSVSDDDLVITSGGKQETIKIEDLAIELRTKLVHEPTIQAREILK